MAYSSYCIDPGLVAPDLKTGPAYFGRLG